MFLTLVRLCLLTGPAGYFKHASVEAFVIRSRLPSHNSAGEKEVWTNRMEYSI